MTVKRYSRFTLAECQLDAAIGLFITGGDRFSVITLAGAADVILSRLVLNSGKENFTDSSLKKAIARGFTAATREEVGKGMNNAVYINQIKHMDDQEDGIIEIEPEECALAAILKALVNYMIFAGGNKPLALAFMEWMKRNLDPKKYNVMCDPEWQPESCDPTG